MKIVISLLFTLSAMGLYAQNYQISFSGSGQSTTIDSVEIHNLSSNLSLTINGTDTLHLEAPVVGFNPIQKNNKFLVYPNPFFEKTYVGFSQQKESLVHVKLFDIIGKVIIEQSLNLIEGEHVFELSGLNKGIYVLSLSNKNSSFSTQIVSLSSLNLSPALSLKSDNVYSLTTRLNEYEKNLIQMPYDDGEVLLITAYSGNFSTVSTLIPTGDVDVSSEFVACADNDGNHYAVVTIGTQTWMAKNLISKTFNDGSPIDYWHTGSWSTSNPAFTWYNETPFLGDSVGYIHNLGLLYNWYVVDSSSNGNKNICPVGWHIPADNEWLTLQSFLGGQPNAGGKLKETGTAYWLTPNANASNSSGFTALPTGYRLWNGTFLNYGYYSYWWSKTPDMSNPNFAWYFGCLYDNASFDGFNYDKKSAYAIRCVKD